MGTEKTKVKGLDVFLQVMIAIFSLGWIVLYVPPFIDSNFGVRSFGIGAWSVIFSSIVFSVIVFVFAAFLFRKVTATVVRVLFTFGFVLMMIHFYNLFGVVLSHFFYNYYGLILAPIWLMDVAPMILLLLMFSFAMVRQKHSGMFIGQVICLILLLAAEVCVGIFVLPELNDDIMAYLLVGAMWTFHLMLALLSIWLRRRNYYRAQEECAAFGCPFFNGGFVPGLAAPMGMPAPIAVAAPVAPMVEKPTQKEPEAFVAPIVPAPIVTEAPKPADGVPCPVCGEICEKDALFCGNCGATLNRKAETTPVVQQEMLKYDATPTLEPEWEEKPATQPDAYEEEPATKIAGFEDVATASEPVEEEEKTETALLPEVEWEEEPATSILVEPVQAEAPIASVAAEPKERFCRNCGTLLEEGTFFCCECGTRIEE